MSLDILYEDGAIIVCIKPPGVLSTDEPEGMPELIRGYLKDPEAEVRTVHRLDRVVSGVMVLARSKQAASALSGQVREHEFGKEYLAVVHGRTEPRGTMTDLLRREKSERKTYVTAQPGKDARLAVLDYTTLSHRAGLSKVLICLKTGRTHQIRAQFSSRALPLVGDRKYSLFHDDCEIALWSYCLRFRHPLTGEQLCFRREPPREYPWNLFDTPASHDWRNTNEENPE